MGVGSEYETLAVETILMEYSYGNSHNRPAALGRTIGKHAPHHSEDKIRLISIYVETVCVFQGTQYSKR